jgi:hypothetical protein
MKWLVYTLGSILALFVLFSGSYGEMSVKDGANATFAVR